MSFLPVNPEFSSTRNQGRQKLARFSAPEFRALIVDVLQEARRRQLGQTAAAAAAAAVTDGDDDEPLYDSVDSEDDYAPLEQVQRRENAQRLLAEQNELLQPRRTESPENDDTEHTKDGSLSSLEGNHLRRASDGSSGGGAEDRGGSRHQPESSLGPQESTEEMRREIDLLRDMVQRLTSENAALRASCAGASAGAGSGPPPLPPHSAPGTGRADQRPVSMFETRERPSQPPTWCLERKLSKGDRSPSASAAGSGPYSLPNVVVAHAHIAPVVVAHAHCHCPAPRSRPNKRWSSGKRNR